MVTLISRAIHLDKPLHKNFMIYEFCTFVVPWFDDYDLWVCTYIDARILDV